MKVFAHIVFLTFVCALVCVPACDTIGGFNVSGSPNGSDPGTGTGDPAQPGDATGTDGTGNDPANSVGDVTTGGGGNGVGRPQPSGSVAARVRNERAVRADVTVRFIDSDRVTHLAFVRVLADTVTTVVSPGFADTVELSGVDERGSALPSRTYSFGVDFDQDTPVEYVIPAGSGDPTGGDPPRGDAEPASLTMLEPDADLSLPLGSTLVTRWEDSGGNAAGVVRIFLQPVGASGEEDRTGMGPGVGAGLDGINDELLVVLQGLQPGTYRIVGVLTSGDDAVTSESPGRLTIVPETGNIAPTLSITSPSAPVALRNGETLAISWTDADPDDNATIRFSLESTTPSGGTIDPFPIGPALAEDPDGPNADAAVITIDGVLTGTYDLVGTISDGRLIGQARVTGIVAVLAAAANDPPTLTLIQPAIDIEVQPGGSFRVQWTDADNNDNARISLMLDPDLDTGSLDGDEVLLVASLGEDEDGSGDSITIGVPTGVMKGTYRLAGAITDGLAELVTWAPGKVFLGVPSTSNPPQISFVAPLTDIRTRVGESLNIAVDTDHIPAGSKIRLFLDNSAYGGDVRTEVTPASVVQNQVMSLPLPPSVPNIEWPRQFDLEAAVYANGDVLATAVAPGAIWVRQEVEITAVNMVNYVCDPDVTILEGPRSFAGVEIRWYGGGFAEREALAPVQFWLSKDGALPADLISDRAHRKLAERFESPNREQVVRLDIGLIAIQPDVVDGGLHPGPLPGLFGVLSLVEPDGFGPITSGPHENLVDICFFSRPGGSGG